MFREILRFELRQQLGRPLTWLVFLAFAAIGVLEMTGPGVRVLGAHDGVARNAPVVIANAVAMFGILATLAAGTFVTSAALRDFDCRTAQLLFAMPVGRRAYIGGRFLAAWLLVLGAMLACTLGIALGNLLPGLAPADAAGAMAYPWSFFVIAVPSTLLVTALLFALALSTCSLLATFTGVACLIVLLFASHAFMHDAGSQVLAAMLDPFGYHTLQSVTRYWPAAEMNARLPLLAGWLLVNRLLWTLIALVVLGLLLVLRWNLLGVGRARGRAVAPAAGNTDVAAAPSQLPAVTLRHGVRANWQRFVHVSAWDTTQVLRGAPFLVLLLFALASVALNLTAQPTLLGVTSLPVTADVVAMIRSSLDWLLAITLIFYAGELAWRDRDLRVACVCDAMPWPDAVAVAAKACVLVAVVIAFFACGALVSIGWQWLHGYTRIQPGLYLGTLALMAVPYVLLAVLCLALQAVCGNRFVAYLLSVLWLVLVKVAAPLLGWDDHLFLYGTAPALPHSALNGYAGFLSAVASFDGYWACLALALLVLAALFWLRGGREPWTRRLRAAGARCGKPAAALLAMALLAFVGAGAWIFHNTHGLNRVYDARRVDRQRADYEKAFAHDRNLPQPKISDETLSVAIAPEQRALDIRGTYTLVNRTATPIDKLLVWYPGGFKLESASLPAHTIVAQQAAPHFVVYQLATPMAPGAALAFAFHLARHVRGFANQPTATWPVPNGSFFDNLDGPDRSGHDVLPHLGYQPYLQLTNPETRRRFGLPPAASPMGTQDDPAARNINAVGGDADWVHTDTTLSTAPDQTAVTVGVLQRTWVADGRRWFHYVTAAPLPNALPFLSARYAVRRTAWQGIGIELYYDPAEAWNVDRMLRTVRDALAFDTEHFGPYPYRQLRVAVVPYNYALAAEAFPGVIVVRESGPAGPESQPPRAGALDPMYALLSHEISHQWWGVQEDPANVRGLNLITEGFAQYASLMLAKQRYGAQAVCPLLRQLQDSYLQGRHRATTPESPLADVGDIAQGYIYYDKAALAFYTLQDYLGEATVNGVLRQFLADTRFKGPPYPTADQFLALLDTAVGAQQRSLVDDLFRRITLFDNRMASASATKLPDGRYRVSMRIHAAEFHANGNGGKVPARLVVPIEVGVFARPVDAASHQESPLYLAKVPLRDGDNTLAVTVDGKPYVAAIDPYHELTDVRPDHYSARVIIH